MQLGQKSIWKCTWRKITGYPPGMVRALLTYVSHVRRGSCSAGCLFKHSLAYYAWKRLEREGLVLVEQTLLHLLACYQCYFASTYANYIWKCTRRKIANYTRKREGLVLAEQTLLAIGYVQLLPKWLCINLGKPYPKMHKKKNHLLLSEGSLYTVQPTLPPMLAGSAKSLPRLLSLSCLETAKNHF